jgi:hypothetical protein
MTFAKTTYGALGILAALAILIPVVITTPVGATSVSSSGSSSSSSSPPPSSGQPGDPGDGTGTGGDGGDIPPPPPEQQLTKLEETCNAALAQLVKIPEKMVADFSNAGGVDVSPVCNAGLGHQAKIDASQALPLQNAIRNNPVLMAALAARGFKAEDVVGVVLIEGVATLYVHKGVGA